VGRRLKSLSFKKTKTGFFMADSHSKDMEVDVTVPYINIKRKPKLGFIF
jgi:hypothetical protein